MLRDFLRSVSLVKRVQVLLGINITKLKDSECVLGILQGTSCDVVHSLDTSWSDCSPAVVSYSWPTCISKENQTHPNLRNPTWILHDFSKNIGWHWLLDRERVRRSQISLFDISNGPGGQKLDSRSHVVNMLGDCCRYLIVFTTNVLSTAIHVFVKVILCQLGIT
jgi:hypothetical protein